MFCVNVKSKEFKEACNRLNIHPSSLEVIVFQYLNNIDAESFPSDEYIISKLEGKAMTDASESQILLWEKAYSTPKVFSDKASVGAFIKEATKYFSPDSISIHRNNEGNYVAKVTKPENIEAYEKELKHILDNAPRNKQGQLLAPNGKPTKLSERQYAQIRTKEFKKWFGDWTKITQNEDGTWNIPADVSKIIDEETGEPKVVFHGSNNTFTEFKTYHKDKEVGDMFGAYFTKNRKYAEKTYGKSVYEVFLNIKSPLNTEGRWTGIINEESYKEITTEYDGIINDNFDNTFLNKILRNSRSELIVFNSNQIKSATDNVGTFSTESDDIDYFTDTNRNKTENKRSTEEFYEGKNLSQEDVKELFERFNNNVFLGKIFTRVFEIWKKIPNVNITIKDYLGKPEYLGTSNRIGEIKYKTSLFLEESEDTIAHILLHEVIHSITTYATYAYINKDIEGYKEIYNSLPDNIKKACEDLQSLYDKLDSKKYLKGKYGLKNIHELLAEISNVDFRNDIRTGGFWDNIILIIRKLLNLGDTKGLIERKEDVKKLDNILKEFLNGYNPNIHEEYMSKVYKGEIENSKKNDQFTSDAYDIESDNSGLKLYSPNIEGTRMNASWARTSENSYEVSTAGDRRFSAMVAKFNPGTIIEGVDVGGMTIEQVYQSVIKKSRKGQPPAEDSILNISNIVSSKGTTKQYGVVIDNNLKSNYSTWQQNNPDGIVAYRVNFSKYNTSEEALAGRIGNPFSEGSNRGENTVKQFFIWLTTGENFGNNKATEEYRQAIISKLLSTPVNSPILYYTELGRPSHATVLGYLINHKELITNFKDSTEDYSYKEGYLPLWQEWAKQNPQLIEELRENSAGKTLTDKFANTRVSQARALAEILNSTRKEESTITESSSELETRTQNEEFMENNKALITELENLYDLGLTDTDIKTLGTQLMYWISEHLTVLHNTPGELKRVYNIDKDASTMSRKDIAELVTPKRLMEQCIREFRRPKAGMDWEAVDHLNDIADNARLLLFLSSNTFTTLEGFSIIMPGADFGIMSDIDVTTNEFNGTNEDVQIQEEEGSSIEHWIRASTTITLDERISLDVKSAISKCYRIGKDGKPVIKNGIKERITYEEARNIIVNICNGCLKLSDMIAALDKASKDYPWLPQLTDQIRISGDKAVNGARSQLQSAFFRDMYMAKNTYSVVKKSGKKYESVIVNENTALKEVTNSIITEFTIGSHPLFGEELGVASYNELVRLYNTIKDITEITEENKEEIINSLLGIYNHLGFYTINEDLVKSILTIENVKDITSSLKDLLLKTVEGYKTQKETGNKYYPFEYSIGKSAPNSILGNLRAILRIPASRIDNTTAFSVYDNGNMYQSFCTPSYLFKLMTKFQLKDDSKFSEFMDNEYKRYQWFAVDVNGKINYRASWLQEMIDHSNTREILKHKIQLNFNKHNYMRNMTSHEYALSVLTEFFSEKSKLKGRDTAWYRVPMLSNKPSSEFIRFVRYTGPMYKTTIAEALYKVYSQELSRIQTVRLRRQNPENVEYISNFDERGLEFCFLTFLNEHLGTDSTLGQIIERRLDGDTSLDLMDQEKSKVIEAITNWLNIRSTEIIASWEDNGILEKAGEIANIGDNKIEVKRNIENFIWNDVLASINIQELTITDPALYKDTEDIQKRIAQMHSPGIRPNTEAVDFDGNRVSDGNHRALTFKDPKDFEYVVSNVIDNITVICDRKIAIAEANLKEGKGTAVEVEEAKAFKELLVGKDGLYRQIEVADAQAYSCATSYRKKAFMFGKWSKSAEAVYKKLINNEYVTLSDIKTAFQPLKPFVYSQISKSSGVKDAPMQTLKVGIQNKNSEYLLVMAEAMLQNEDTGKPNLLRAISEFMEESAKRFPTRGIDTVQFGSAVKVGKQVRLIDISKAESVEDAKEIMRSFVYPDYVRGTWDTYVPKDPDNPYTEKVDTMPMEDYSIQQEVPAHFRDHQQAEGSQERAIIPSDLPSVDAEGNPVTFATGYNIDGTPTGHMSSKEFAREWEETHALNIEESIEMIIQELQLDSLSKKDRNIAIARLLQREILANPNRYGTDLLIACSLTDSYDFRVPLGDPIQSKRVEQLLNSVVKNRINKQTIAGGPIVQVSNFGTSRRLSIVFNGKDGKPLRQRKKNETDVEYTNYIAENQAGIAYMECMAPAYTKELFANFADGNGNIDVEAIEKTSPELLKMIGYRIPTEDKYSIAPLKIVGFLPRVAGDGIMLPYDITCINGSDYDVDKMYVMFKEYKVRKKDITKEEEAALKKTDSTGHTYRANRYECVEPDSPRARRNNKIVDMAYAVMTHETTVDKALNPGGFEAQKHSGYLAEAFRKAVAQEGITDREKLLSKYRELERLSVSELKKLAKTKSNLIFIDTQVQFYEQNNAAGALIGIFAVDKVAHAFLGNDGLTYHGIKKGRAFSIGGIQIRNGVDIDPVLNRKGQYIGKILGSLVASAADAVKDPVLNLMNINGTTAATLCTMVRLGIPFETAALFLSSRTVKELLNIQARENLTKFTTLSNVIDRAIEALGINPNNTTLNTEDLTEEEMIIGLINPTNEIKYKTLRVLSSLLKINSDVKSLSFPTRMNSMAGAVGPLAIDNLILMHKLNKFPKEAFKNSEGQFIDVNYIFDSHPMLKAFYKANDIADRLLKDIPANSMTFKNVIYSGGDIFAETMLSDRKLLSKLSDFYLSYILVSSGVINPKHTMHYINNFPKKYMEIIRSNPELKNNALIDAIKLDMDRKTKKPVLKVETTGASITSKEHLMGGWTELVRNPNTKDLAIHLFRYNFFRGGVVFNPKTFMGLTTYQVKEAIPGYNEAYTRASIPLNECSHVVDLFVRNNWNEVKLVPQITDKTIIENILKDIENKDENGIVNTRAYSGLENTDYFKMEIDGSTTLWKIIDRSDETDAITITQVEPLGNNGEYLELSKDSITDAHTKTTESEEVEDSGDIIGDTHIQTSEGTVDSYSENTSSTTTTGEILAEYEEAEYRLEGKKDLSKTKQLDHLVKVSAEHGVTLNRESIEEESKKYC